MPREPGSGRRPRPVPRLARSGRSSWSREVRLFRDASLARAYIGEDWRRRIVYELDRCPELIRRSGGGPGPPGAAELSRPHLEALRRGLPWAPTTLALHFAALRRFARWAGNPLASEAGAWAVPSGAPRHRRWLTRRQLAQLYRASKGSERVLVSLEGLNGLRRVEVLRARFQDLDLERGRIRVLGKGQNGGKWRTIPVSLEAARILRKRAMGQPPDARILPVSRSGADLLLARASLRSGLRASGVRVSHHDLRRTFGRLAHLAGMDLVQLKNLYGHASLDQTVHYIGLDEDQMRRGLDRLTRSLRPLL